MDLLAEVKLGHPVLVDLDLFGLAFGVELAVSQREQVLLGLGHVCIRRQFHAGVSLILLLLRLGRVETWTLGPSSCRATGRRAGG